MKKISLFTLSAFIMAFLFSATSCNKIKDAVAQNIPDITYNDDKPVIIIPASSSTAQQSALGQFTFDLNQYVKDNAGGSGIDFSAIKHIYVKSINATLLNGDADNNFSNFTYDGTNPVIVFNTTPDYATATQIGGGLSMAPTDPYNLVLPVTNNTDFLSHINGKDWVYIFAYKLSKHTSKAMQVKLDVQYDLSFKQ